MKRDYAIVSLDTSGASPAKGNHGDEMIAPRIKRRFTE